MKLLLSNLVVVVSLLLGMPLIGIGQESENLDQRIFLLTNELRCLVCQNQSLAESEAALAVDLKNKVVKLIEQGKTDDQIREYMVSRYGDFVLYDPPFKLKTMLLWWGPFLILLLMLIMAKSFVSNKKIITGSQSYTEEQLRNARKKLNE